MISLRSRYRFVTFPLPFRYRPVTVLGSYYTPLPSRYGLLPLLTVFLEINIFFIAVLKVAGIYTFKKI